MKIRRFGIDFLLISTITIIFAFCITEYNAGVLLRNFKSRRMIMEELEEEEKEALKARLSLNLTNSTDVSNVTVKTSTSRNLNNSSDKNATMEDFAAGWKNISKSQTMNSKATSKKKIPAFKSPKSAFITQTINKTSSREQNILTSSVVEYLENRGKRAEDRILTSENVSTDKARSHKPKILTKSVVEYVESRGKRMEEDTPIGIPKNNINESAPFRLISHFNESVDVINEISDNSSEAKSIHLDGNNEMSVAEQEKIFTALHDNHTLENSKNSVFDGKQNTENGIDTEQQLNKNISDILKDIFNENIRELPENNFTDISSKPHDEKQMNDSRKSDETESTDLENLVSSNHLKDSELNNPLNDSVSEGHTGELSDPLTVHTRIEDSKTPLNDVETVNKMVTKDNETLIEKTGNETEEDNMVKPFEIQEESSDIIKETAKEIAEILPESNETIAIENIEQFVVNLTDTVQSMSDEDIIHLEPEEEQTSQSIQNINTMVKDNVSAAVLNDTLDEFELSLESVVSSGLDFIVNSEVAKNAAMAMEVFNLSDSSLADHVIEDSDMHSFIDIVMPSEPLNEIESAPKERESIGLNETIAFISNSSVKVSEVQQKNSTLDANSKFNTSLVENDISILDSVLDSSTKPNVTSASERKCPTPGICVFWFMARDSCSDHSQCLGDQMCCRVRCSKSCIDV